MTEYTDIAMSDLVYIQSICRNRSKGVSVCVCVCACLYSPNKWTNFDETFQKSHTRHLWGLFFAEFKNSNLMTSWRPFMLFLVRPLSRSQFCSFCVQVLGHGSKLLLVFAIWNQQTRLITWKLWLAAFSKKDKMAAKNKIFETRQVRCLYRLKLTCWSRIW